MKKSILFIGNSYTYYHNMPESIFAVKASAAGYDFEVHAVTHGGYHLSQFADPQNEEGLRLRSVIENRHFDYIVLQDQSLSTITDPGNFFNGISLMKDLLADKTGQFILFATWGRKPGCETLEEIGMSHEEMTRHIAEYYDEAGQRFGMRVAHVGRAFSAYAQEHPEAELYFSDLHHSSPLGSAIAAEVILKVIAG